MCRITTSVRRQNQEQQRFRISKKIEPVGSLGIKSIKQGGFPLSKKGAIQRMIDEEEDRSSFSNSRLSEVEASTVNQ